MDYEGRVYVDPGTTDDDFIGFVFSYQNESRFYLVSWKRHEFSRAPGRPGVAVKVPVFCCLLSFAASVLLITESSLKNRSQQTVA